MTMHIQKARAILVEHNDWRKGAERPIQDPKVLGDAIDRVVAELDQCRNLRAALSDLCDAAQGSGYLHEALKRARETLKPMGDI